MKLNPAFFIVVCCLACAFRMQAQNLVPNGGFEKHISFDAHSNPHYTTNKVVSGWEDFNAWWSAYCHKDLVRKFGYESFKRHGFFKFDTANVFDGNAMVKMLYGESCPDIDTGCTGYLKTKLIAPLELGEVYEASMWVYMDDDPSTDTSIYTRIGMYLTRHAIPYFDHQRMLPVDYFFNGKVMPGKWTEIKWYIRAQCKLEHLTIGMFRDSTFKSLYRGINNPHYFFVDEVSIVKVNPDTLSSAVYATPYCEFYETKYREQQLASVTSADVHFASNAYELDDDDKATVDSFYVANRERKDKILVVIGHTDNQHAENLLLSERRANSIKVYLIQQYGLPSQSILTFGLGSDHPSSTNATDAGRYKNRRATIRTSNLTIQQLIYRQGLESLSMDSIAKANAQFMRWVRLAPRATRIEMLTDPRLGKLKRSSYWKSLVAEVKKSYVVYTESKNAFYLDSLYFEDQRYRTPNYYKLSGIIEEIDTVTAPELKFNEAEALRRDSFNFLAVERYFLEHGFPTIASVGRRQARGFSYVILHSGDIKAYEKYIPLIEKRCMEGEGEWSLFAMMSDKLSCEKGEFQKYGTQYVRDEHNQSVLYKMENIEEVNKRRIRIGLTPLRIEK
jgi:outer membrane protein OmpA-like peptidoglycan-associated protein